MKPEAQRIAIAEACGWKHIHWNGGDSIPFGDNPKGNKSYRAYDTLHDYLNDLNAMHEVEKTLDYEYWYLFILHLGDIVQLSNHLKWITPYNYVSATASQRAEAFLRTIGKWVEESDK